MMDMETVVEQIEGLLNLAKGYPGTANMYMLQALGVIEFAACLAHRNHDSDLAGNILKRWNNEWSKEFSKIN